MTQQLDSRSPLYDKLVKSVIQSTEEVLSTMAFTTAVFKEVRTEESYCSKNDISAVIGIFSDNGGEGMFTISFSTHLADLIVSRLLGAEPSSLSVEDRCDGVRELVNMISGSTKAAMAQGGTISYRLSIPTVIIGADHKIANQHPDTPCIAVIFEAEGDSFTMQVSFKESA